MKKKQREFMIERMISEMRGSNMDHTAFPWQGWWTMEMNHARAVQLTKWRLTDRVRTARRLPEGVKICKRADADKEAAC